MADVAIIYLPTGENGIKQGVDDFLAAGNSVEDLLSLATPELREPLRDEEDETPSIPYRSTPNGIVWDKLTKDGPVPTPLTNFLATIANDVVEDDGAQEKRSFEIEAHLNGRHSTFTVPSERFSTMSWPSEHLGANGIVYSGSGTKDHARVAIQLLSGEVPTRYVYAHTGWRKIGEVWVYLHAGGAIGSEGPVSSIEVSLGDGRLGDYLLPDPPTGQELQQAIEVLLRFLELAPSRITVPLLAAAFRAVLGEMLAVDLSVYVVGPTGVLKTELTAILQALFGAAFNGRNLPANWTSTENALEKQAFAVKDAILTVDDFAPTGTTYDVARLHRTADRVLRAQGNRGGRGRMQADTSLRAVYHPRGFIASSGEDVPRGQSLRSRMATLELSPGDVDLEVLTEMQQRAAEGVPASAMSAFIQWLAPQVESLKETLPERHRELRRAATGAGAHARTPDMVASLYMGLEKFLEFAIENEAITAAHADELREKGWKALGEVAAAQVEHQAAEEPTQQFIELLVATLAGGDAHIADAESGEEPENAQRWGWRPNVDGDQVSRGRRIGWVNKDGSVFLEPGAAFATAQDMARRQGTSLTIGQRALWKRLSEKGLLASRDNARNRNVTRATINKNRVEVVHLIPGVLSSNGPNDPPPAVKGRSGPEDGAVSPLPGTETARKNGPNSAENSTCGPKGPFGPFSGGGPAEKVEGGARHLSGVAPHLIETETSVQEFLPRLRKVNRVALDLETTGLDPRKDRVRLLSLATEQGTWLIDCFEVDPRPIFPILAEKELIIHNALFDLGMLSGMGFELGQTGKIFDTMVSSQLSEGDYPEDEEEQ